MKCSATTANFKNVACKFQKLSHWGIPGVLAVDVCKGFAVTMMCLSCENAVLQLLRQACVKHVVGKARCPKNKILKDNTSKNSL